MSVRLGTTKLPNSYQLHFLGKDRKIAVALFQGEKRLGERDLDIGYVEHLEYTDLTPRSKNAVDLFLRCFYIAPPVSPLALSVPVGSVAETEATEDGREIVEHIGDLIKRVPVESGDERNALTKALFQRILSVEEPLSPTVVANAVLVRSLKNEKGETLLLASAALVDSEKFEKIFELFERSRELTVKDEKGRNALHFAAAYNHLTILPRLLRYFEIGDKDCEGFTPLYWAIRNKNTAMVRKLLEFGAQLTAVKIRDSIEVGPLAIAIFAGNPETLDVLLEKDRFGYLGLDAEIIEYGSVIHLAIRSEQSEMLAHLFKKYADEISPLLQRKDPLGRTPLQLAAFTGDLLAINLLHSRGVDLNYGNGLELGTAMHYAALGKQPQAIELLDWLGSSHEVTDESQRRPYTVVVTDDSPSAIECRALLSRLPHVSRAEKTEPPKYKNRHPHNLVFQGGGAKGLAFLGALEQMEEMKVLGEVRRIAGTSAGAITAAFLAVGYTPPELRELLARDFTEFLDAPHPLETHLLEAAADPSKTRIVKNLLSSYWQGVSTLTAPLQRAREFYRELRGVTGLAAGEAIREWIEKAIAAKTGIPGCTFGELFALARRTPQQFKELYVYSTCLKGSSLPSKIVRFSHELHEGMEWTNLVISDAVRASLSIPGVFKPHVLHFKDASGRHPRSDLGHFIDGGVLRNFPLTTFDDEKYQEERFFRGEKTNRRTLGLSLHEELIGPIDPSAVEAFDMPQLLKALVSTYYNAEQILMDETGSYKDRTVIIPVRGVSTTDFGLSAEQKAALVESGKGATSAFFLRPL